LQNRGFHGIFTDGDQRLIKNATSYYSRIGRWIFWDHPLGFHYNMRDYISTVVAILLLVRAQGSNFGQIGTAIQPTAEKGIYSGGKQRAPQRNVDALP
jgi:hypothetical protein